MVLHRQTLANYRLAVVRRVLALIVLVSTLLLTVRATPDIQGTAPLQIQGDLSEQMVNGIARHLLQLTTNSLSSRAAHWNRDFSSVSAYNASVEENRAALAKIAGAVDERVDFDGLDYIGTTSVSARVADAETFVVYAVRWPVFSGVFAEGLLLQPRTPIRARVIAIPDADHTPEMISGISEGVSESSRFARRLAENGCQVLVPTLVSRSDEFSGSAELGLWTNQPHREWIYRQAYELGRHIIGFEIQKVRSAIDWFERQNRNSEPNRSPIAVAGYGEGGLLAFYTAALDIRVDACLVSGYFGSREDLWSEPIYRNQFGLLNQFGDAEIATLIAPRRLVIEDSPVPVVTGPPTARKGRQGAAPGAIKQPTPMAIRQELQRARMLVDQGLSWDPVLVQGEQGIEFQPGSSLSLKSFLASLGVQEALAPTSPALLSDTRKDFNPSTRQREQVDQLVRHCQELYRRSERVRDQTFWDTIETRNKGDWAAATQPPREQFWGEVIGRCSDPNVPMNVRSRPIEEGSNWVGHQVVIDVWEDVFAWGYLLLPKNLEEGEKRPVVVCQHGLEGLPSDTIQGPTDSAYRTYRGFASRLADRGFIVFAPHNPYRGGDRFRRLQRMANPLHKSLFSIIIGQHQRILEWLGSQPYVDPSRIGFYGLSYGGKTAMRVPAVLDGYCLSICSADFNEWIRKNVTVDSPYSYLFTGEYEMPEFGLGDSFSYAEMAALIAPRPFMVERGHRDGVAPDEWVAYEYAKVRRLYAELGIRERTAIEFFDGPHQIHGVDTFQFLYRHLNWRP